MLALSCTYEMTPHALSCMERDLTLLTLIFWFYPGFATRFEQISEGDVGC